jgi:peptidoglycan pentaglycine glycine transferase (the first glycine)
MNTEFLQSPEWLRLQEATGKSIIPFEEGDFAANGIVHRLPVVGEYLYVPRGPAQNNFQFSIFNFQKNIQKLVGMAKERELKWIRIEPETEEMLEAIQKAVSYRVVRAPHDMQPQEVFKIDITKSEETLFSEMKPKTRYNIRLAEKRGVKILETRERKYIVAFLDLITATSGRKGIVSHPKSYYEQFFQALPETMCRLFVAEYQGAVIAANLVISYGDTVTYLHGGTADFHRDVMAPYLLQWEQIKAAKAGGYRLYDFGGIKINNNQQITINKVQKLENKSNWEGITRFKKGFSSRTAATIFPGSYDIILDSPGYFLYDALRFVQRWKNIIFH